MKTVHNILVVAAFASVGPGRLMAQTAACVATATSMTPAGWTSPALPAVAPRSHLRVVADIPLPGPANRFDYQSVKRLYINHMNAGRLIVFDLDSSRVVADIEGVDRATGVLVVPSQHKVFVSAAGRHALVVFDDRTLKVEGRVDGIRFPDGIAYAPTPIAPIRALR